MHRAWRLPKNPIPVRLPIAEEPPLVSVIDTTTGLEVESARASLNAKFRDLYAAANVPDNASRRYPLFASDIDLVPGTGVGYVSALVQLHFQHASAGELLPSPEDAVRVFHGETGEKPQSKIEQLLPEDYKETKMNGQGQMTSAFYKRAEDYSDAIA